MKAIVVIEPDAIWLQTGRDRLQKTVTIDLQFMHICIAKKILKLSFRIINGLQFGSFFLEFGCRIDA